MQKFYDTIEKRNYWMLGYHSRKVSDIYKTSNEFQEETGVEFDTIVFDEILSSSRFKSMYIMFSTQDNQTNKGGCKEMEDVYKFFRA